MFLRNFVLQLFHKVAQKEQSITKKLHLTN